MKNEKILVQDDKAGAEREINKLVAYIPTLNQLQEVFESLDLGKITEETALSLLLDKGETVGEMFLSAIAADCYATGNKNKHFVNQQIKAQEETVNNFKKEVNSTLSEINDYPDYRRFSYSEINGYYVSDRTKEEILESYKKYLTDPKEIELYLEFERAFKSLQTLNNALCKFKGFINKYSLAPYFERTDNSSHFGSVLIELNKNKVLELFKKKTTF